MIHHLGKAAKNRRDDHLDDLRFRGSHRKERPSLIGGLNFYQLRDLIKNDRMRLNLLILTLSKT